MPKYKEIKQTNNSTLLRSLNTKQLLKLRDKTYKFGRGYCLFEHQDRQILLTQKEIIGELSKREHIPNKKERKIIRQQKAKSKTQTIDFSAVVRKRGNVKGKKADFQVI